MRLPRPSLRSACSINSKSSGLSSTKRISTSFVDILVFSLRSVSLWRRAVDRGPCVQREIERRPAVELSLSPDASAVALHNSRHRGQADARALEIFGAMQALENAKEF